MQGRFYIKCRKEAKKSQNCEICGTSPADKKFTKFSKKIINGIEIQNKNKYPWIVYLTKEGSNQCGGAIISDRYILTAAHCLLTRDAMGEQSCLQTKKIPRSCYLAREKFRVGVLSRNGSYDLKEVDKIIPHPTFNINGKFGDIGLMKLKEPILCGVMRSPICLPRTNLNKFNQSLKVAGMGRYSEQDFEQKLRETRMTQVHKRRCRADEDGPKVARKYLCAVAAKTNQKTCYGDSGSSIFSKFGEKYFSLGVTSFGYSNPNELCSLDRAATFTKVYYYMKWIKKYVKHIPEP